jgi:hypothetical protein
MVASKCAINYGAMGAVGFLYESVKDELKWAGFSQKHYTNFLIRLGQIFVMEDKEFNKQKVKYLEMNTNEIKATLIAAFGDGK